MVRTEWSRTWRGTWLRGMAIFPLAFFLAFEHSTNPTGSSSLRTGPGGRGQVEAWADMLSLGQDASVVFGLGSSPRDYKGTRPSFSDSSSGTWWEGIRVSGSPEISVPSIIS